MAEQNKLQEMQMLEQGLQNLLLQKQAFQMELSETLSAKREIEKSGEDSYKIVGQLLIKTEKAKILQELSDKERLLSLRLKTLEKQESAIIEKTASLRKGIIE